MNFIALIFACTNFMSIFFQMMYMYVDAKRNRFVTAHIYNTHRTIK